MLHHFHLKTPSKWQWRLLLFGHRILSAPFVVVYHFRFIELFSGSQRAHVVRYIDEFACLLLEQKSCLLALSLAIWSDVTDTDKPSPITVDKIWIGLFVFLDARITIIIEDMCNPCARETLATMAHCMSIPWVSEHVERSSNELAIGYCVVRTFPFRGSCSLSEDTYNVACTKAKLCHFIRMASVSVNLQQCL